MKLSAVQMDALRNARDHGSARRLFDRRGSFRGWVQVKRALLAAGFIEEKYPEYPITDAGRAFLDQSN